MNAYIEAAANEEPCREAEFFFTVSDGRRLWCVVTIDAFDCVESVVAWDEDGEQVVLSDGEEDAIGVAAVSGA